MTVAMYATIIETNNISMKMIEKIEAPRKQFGIDL
jgi:hypothetical protein